MRKMIKLFSWMASLALAAAVSPALAQTAASTPAAAATPAAPTVTVGGLVDTYYSYNFTNESNNSDLIGNNGTFFNTADNSYSLGMAEVNVTATQGQASGHLTLTTGQGSNLGLAGTGIDILQGYVSYAPADWTFNFGRFVTWMGDEVIESKSNWNYSRSLLFWYTIPLWHTGFSASVAPSSQWGFTGYVTDGWNTSAASLLGKTYGLEVSFKPDSTLGFTLNGIAGPGWVTSNNPAPPPATVTTNYGAGRYIGELIVSYAPNSSWSFALDGEYGVQDMVGSNAALSKPVTLGDNSVLGNAPFWGVDLYGRYQIQSDWAVALRLEELKDTYGILGVYGLLYPGNNALYAGKGPYDVEAREATLTVEHNFTANLLARLEGRMDMAYSGGTQLSSTVNASGIASPFAGGSGTQTTGTASLVLSF